MSDSFETPWTVSRQAPLFMGFSRQEYWSRLDFLLQCLKVKSESEFAQSCLTLSDPRDCRLQAPQSMGFSRQEYWSGVQLPSPKIQYSQINKYFSKRITLRYVRRHCELTSGSTQSLFNSSITFFEFFLLLKQIVNIL